MDIWIPNVGDENLYLEPEDENEYGKNDVAVLIGGITFGHIPKNLSKTFNRFLTLPKLYNKMYCNWKASESWCWLWTRDSCKF